MMTDFYEEKNDIFSIIVSSLLFHFVIFATLILIVWLRPAKESPPPIPFFELVNVAPPPPAPKQAVKQEEIIPEPVQEIPPEPIAETPVPKPEINPELKPEPKAERKPEPAPKQESAAAASMDMPMDMDLPKDIVKKADMDMPPLRLAESSVQMDPQLKAYLSTLQRLIYQNFNPPSGTEIASGTKSSVQFQIARNGEISEVVLRSSSGNSIWDRLAVRAVQITKPPPLPPSYLQDDLPLIFDFREK